MGNKRRLMLLVDEIFTYIENQTVGDEKRLMLLDKLAVIEDNINNKCKKFTKKEIISIEIKLNMLTGRDYTLTEMKYFNKNVVLSIRETHDLLKYKNEVFGSESYK